MQSHFAEQNTLIIPTIPVSLTASTPITSAYVNTTGCDTVEATLFLAVSVAGATSVGLLSLVAAADNAGASEELLEFQYVYKTLGATIISAGTGKPTKIEQAVGSVPMKIESWSTLAADGDKQQILMVPVRSRSMPSGKPWLAIRFTAGSATARNGSFVFLRMGEQYGKDNGTTLL